MTGSSGPVAGDALGSSSSRAMSLALKVVGAAEIASPADRPDHRRGVERQRLLDLVEQLERLAALAVHLVDERDDRNVAQPADLEQLARARLDAACAASITMTAASTAVSVR